MENSMGPADFAAMTNSKNGDGLWSNPFVYLIWMYAFQMFGNNGYGNAAWQNNLTRSDMYEGFNTNQLLNDNRAFAQELNNSRADAQMNTASIISAINQNGFNSQQCCCETNRNIDALRYANEQQACNIMQNANANTQRIIDTITHNEVQALRDQLQSANFQLSQLSQTEKIVDKLRPVATPSYLVSSPYQALGYNGMGYGCPCSA